MSVEFDTARLHRLRSTQVGGILLVVIHWDVATASFDEPIFQVLASPAVGTLGSFSTTDRLPTANTALLHNGRDDDTDLSRNTDDKHT